MCSFDYYLALSTVTANPFSIKDLSRGAGGTFHTQALILTPPTVVVHVPHSPYSGMVKDEVMQSMRIILMLDTIGKATFITFLHRVGTLSPSFCTA
jgi:hypothetical protein